jgi:hypothetical protein
MTNQENEKIELSPQQANPYACRPEDWQVGAPVQTGAVPGNGQRGSSVREEAQLLAKRKAQGRGVDLPTRTDDAAPYDIHNE